MSDPFERIRAADATVAAELEDVERELKAAGAGASAQRLEFACQRAGDVPLATVYSLVDPGRLAEELDEATSKQSHHYSNLRNLLALAPLLFTWFALALASNSYQAEIAAATGDARDELIRTPFLILWQQGFGTRSPFTFTFTALIDVVLILAILAVTWWVQQAEGRARAHVRGLVAKVDKAVAGVVALSTDQGFVPDDAKPEDWARVVQATINKAQQQTETLINASHAATRDVADKAKSVMEEIGKANEELIRHEMQPLVRDFKASIGELKKELTNYQASVATIGQTINQLGQAAGVLAQASQDLAANSGTYNATATAIAGHIKGLEATQQQLVGQITQAAADMRAAAAAAQQLAQGNSNIVTNLDRASKSLQRTENSLDNTANLLGMAAKHLDGAARRYSLIRYGLLGRLFGSSSQANP